MQHWCPASVEDWAVTAADAGALVAAVAALAFPAAAPLRLLVVGAGYSRLAARLAALPCVAELIVTDVDPDALDHQRQLLKECKAKTSVQCLLLDLLEDKPAPFDPVDLLVDKSTLDAILVLKGRTAAKQAVARAFRRLLRPGGVYLNVSMFIPETKRLLSGPGRRCALAQVEYTLARTTRAGRPTRRNQWFCVYLCTASDSVFQSLSGAAVAMGRYALDFRDARKVRTDDLNPGASFFGPAH
eukprot:EG_transcript_24291